MEGFDNCRCPKITGYVGTDLELLVSVESQRVQVTVLENVGIFAVKSFFLNRCDAVDADNWTCDNSAYSGEVITASVAPEIISNRCGMHHGHYYHVYRARTQPDFYETSVSGWRRLGLKNGVLTPEQAYSYESE
jgi:hypothetical protein